jgi:hypothetical protein
VAPTSKPVLAGPSRPLGSPEIPQVYLPTTSKKGTYSPKLYGAATVMFFDRKRKAEQSRPVAFVVPLAPGMRTVDWETSQPCPVNPSDLLKEAPVEAPYLPLPSGAMNLKTFTSWVKKFDRWLARTQKLDVTVSKEPLEVWSLSPKRGGVSVEIVAIAWDLV